jgi:hypothetical protein
MPPPGHGSSQRPQRAGDAQSSTSGVTGSTAPRGVARPPLMPRPAKEKKADVSIDVTLMGVEFGRDNRRPMGPRGPRPPPAASASASASALSEAPKLAAAAPPAPVLVTAPPAQQ